MTNHPLSERHRTGILRLLDMLEKGDVGELIIHIMRMEDEFEEAMENIKVFSEELIEAPFTRKVTKRIIKEVAKGVESLRDEITPRAGEHFPSRGELDAQIRGLVARIPIPKGVNEKKIIKKITKDLKKSLKVKDGRASIVDYDFLVKQVLKRVIPPEPGKNGSPDSAEDVANKLETLDGDKRLNVSAIDGLSELLKELRELANARRTGMGGTPFYKTMIDDFSDDTDGSKKEFILSRQPRKTNTVMLWGSDFPTILRPTIDFTIAGKTLTLTAQMDAPVLGSTLICQYVT